MRRNRPTKILATLGPASDDKETIRALVQAGADLFRLNFSHGRHEDHASRHRIIRALEEELNTPIGILVDLQGPKIRIGTFANGAVMLKRGQTFILDRDPAPGDETRVCLPHPEVFEAVEPGHRLLLDDGKVRLIVRRASPEQLVTEAETDGRLSDRKGVNLPGTLLNLSALSAKDRRDLAFALDLGVDWVALSFVQRPEDMAEARRLVGGRAALMAKIEKPSAVTQIDSILELSDAIMIARGDLGVELPIEEVPAIQKRLINTARLAGKPVVVATQMLESMITSPFPTRAEVSDVATAVYDGADAIMLSAESAAGAYPVEAVSMMDRIAVQSFRDPKFATFMDAGATPLEATSADAITAAARQVAETISANVIATYSTSGSTTMRASRERPNTPILGLSPNRDTARRLTLAWGVHCALTDDPQNFGEMVARACHTARELGYAAPGDKIVITAGVPFGTPGATNILRIAWIRPPGE